MDDNRMSYLAGHPISLATTVPARSASYLLYFLTVFWI